MALLAPHDTPATVPSTAVDLRADRPTGTARAGTGTRTGTGPGTTVRLAFSAAVPTAAAMRARVSELVRAAAAEGHDRADLRVLLEVEVVLAVDERDARLRRSRLEHLDALAGLTWSPTATRVVTTPDRLVDEVRGLAERSGADAVRLIPLNRGPAARRVLLDLVA